MLFGFKDYQYFGTDTSIDSWKQFCFSEKNSIQSIHDRTATKRRTKKKKKKNT